MLLDRNIDKLKLLQYIFIGYNNKTLNLLLYRYRLQFPIFLSHRSRLDKEIINLLWPLIDSGTRLNSFYNLLKELYIKKYYSKIIQKEHWIIERKLYLTINKYDKEYFSEFSNKLKYNIAIPSYYYLIFIYKKFYFIIRNDLLRKIKNEQHLIYTRIYLTKKLKCSQDIMTSLYLKAL